MPGWVVPVITAGQKHTFKYNVDRWTDEHFKVTEA